MDLITSSWGKNIKNTSSTKITGSEKMAKGCLIIYLPWTVNFLEYVKQII